MGKLSIASALAISAALLSTGAHAKKAPAPKPVIERTSPNPSAVISSTALVTFFASKTVRVRLASTSGKVSHSQPVKGELVCGS